MAETTEVIHVENLRIPLDDSINLPDEVAAFLDVPVSTIQDVSILRRSTDARQRNIFYVYTLVVTLLVEKEIAEKIVTYKCVTRYTPPKEIIINPVLNKKAPPIIIGCGPAGLFAAIMLVKRGRKPIVFEQGERIPERVSTVGSFWNGGLLNAESNVLFGEGGAGTFSDGKLTTRIKTSLKKTVLETFVRAGAPEEILYVNKPHIGTDRLRNIIPAIVDDLKNQGVQFHFNTKVTDISIENGSVCGVKTCKESIKTDTVFLALGHSARDMYALLHDKGIELEQKNFAVGVRIEHPRELIDKKMHGEWAGSNMVGAAEYVLTFKDTVRNRGVYSFCMCPGGYVIACASSEGHLCSNGMSAFNRNAQWSNAAIVVTVRPDDFGQEGPLGGILFQKKLEKETYVAGGGNYCAPVQYASDFIENHDSPGRTFQCSFRPGIVQANLRDILPDFLTQPLAGALKHFNRKMPGFIEEGILIGTETRTSAPVRIVRNSDTFHSPSVRGLIPVGEGSGYAGGIMSSAVDGLQAALVFDR